MSDQPRNRGGEAVPTGVQVVHANCRGVVQRRGDPRGQRRLAAAGGSVDADQDRSSSAVPEMAPVRGVRERDDSGRALGERRRSVSTVMGSTLCQIRGAPAQHRHFGPRTVGMVWTGRMTSAAAGTRPARAPLVLAALILVAAVCEPEPGGCECRVAGYRQGVRREPDAAQPDCRRLLGRACRFGALPRSTRRPVRAQDDAGTGDGAVRARIRHRRDGADRRGVDRRATARWRRGRHGLPDHSRVDHRALVGAGTDEGDRVVVRDRWRYLVARPARVRGPAEVVRVGLGVPGDGPVGWWRWARRWCSCRATSTSPPTRSIISAASSR